MQSRWEDNDARRAVERYAAAGVNEDVALRVYTTQLLGRDPRLVLHGGGNTSVKTTLPDLSGDQVEVLCVKGSGWDMAVIEPAGLPAVRLAPLLALRSRETLSDEDMVRLQRASLIEPNAPTPSVEALLHAFIPHKFVDHTHATAVLSLIDQPDAEALCRDVFAERAGLVPYVMPGFALAKRGADIFDAQPRVEALILHKHGLFTFGSTAREAYERMIDLVSLAETRIAQGRSAVFRASGLPDHPAPLAEVAPIVRGACALAAGNGRDASSHYVMDFRQSEMILAYVSGAERQRYALAGVVTPDHTIRTKNWPLILPAAQTDQLETFKQAARDAAQEFKQRYLEYFARNNARSDEKTMLDPAPRVVLAPGLGLFGLGSTKKDARIVADLAVSAVEAITGAEAIGRFESISEADMFDVEYWSLEQAKLGKAAPKSLAGQVAVITGAAGAIGAATARAFATAGAEVALLDVALGGTEALAAEIGGGALALACDVTDPVAVRLAFERICETFGGLDIAVSNAGAARQGRIGEVDEAVLRRSFELNFYAHQRVAQNAVRIMRAQGTGGCLLFNVSKQAVNPGPDFGPYGIPKAATLALLRQYALDYGRDGIRANGVNADRIRSGLLTDTMIADRAQARGVSEENYMSGNLLGREVTADDVAQGFLALALARKTTGHVMTIDGGNIAASLR